DDILQMVAMHVSDSTPSTRIVVSVSLKPGRAVSAVIRANVGTSSSAEQCGVTIGCVSDGSSRKRAWGPAAPPAEDQASGREDPPPLDRAWRATGSVRWHG